jgi:hypothetical protein
MRNIVLKGKRKTQENIEKREYRKTRSANTRIIFLICKKTKPHKNSPFERGAIFGSLPAVKEV